MSAHWFDLSAVNAPRQRRERRLIVPPKGVKQPVFCEPPTVERKRNGTVTVTSYGKDGSRIVKMRSGNTPYGVRAARKAAQAAELSVKEVYVTAERVVTTPTLYEGTAERANVAADVGSAKLLSPTKRREIMRLRRGY